MEDLYVDKPQELTGLCERLRNGDWLALDTEFIRESTYYPRLCLIQTASEDRVACIDPLLLEDLSPLLEILYDPKVTKVLHSAHQDLEIFFNLRGKVPCPVFDTQIAATLLGHGDQIGYAALVTAMLGVTLDKSQTRTDWGQRPLEPAQIHYALDDVRFLRRIYHRQHEELTHRHRLDWLTEDFRALCDPTKYRLHPDEAWRRVKGTQQLRGKQLAVLRQLAAWRETYASQADRPRQWVLGDEVLLELARRTPSATEHFGKVRGLGPGTIRRHGEILLALVQKACNEPPERWPVPSQRVLLGPEQEALVDAAMAVLRMRSAATGVSQSTLASRKDLERLVVEGTDIALLHGWRAAVAGHEVQALLQGKLSLTVHQGRLTTLPSGSGNRLG